MNNPVDVLANSLKQKYDNEFLLGYLCYYHVPESFGMQLDTWAELIVDTEIEDLEVKPPQKSDVFKRAVACMNGQKVEGGEKVWRIISRDAGYDDDSIYRSAVVEELDSDHHRLSYNEVWQFRFRKNSGVVEIVELNQNFIDRLPVEIEFELQRRQDEVFETFEILQSVLSANKMREIIRLDIEGTMRGIPAKPGGGLHFVYNGYSNRLHAFENVLRSCEGCMIRSFPLVRDEATSDAMKDAFEDEVEVRSDLLMGEMAEFMSQDSKKSITLHDARAVKQKVADLRNLAISYSEYLNREFISTATFLELLEGKASSMFRSISK